MRGLIGELYLDDLREKTHRGLVGKVTAGKAVAGPAYGYRLVREASGSHYVVDPDQAKVVQEIFARYAAGAGLQSIVFDLNARHVPSPRGSTWAVSALYGAPNKGSGILNNTMYVGRTVWNRSQFVKDPDTGKRRRIDRPREEWIEAEAPELRIVDGATWEKVRARIDNRRPKGGAVVRTLFGGLLRCPHCHGPMIAIDRRAYGCAARMNRGPAVCRGLTLRRTDVDGSLLAMLQLMMEREDFAADFQRELRAQLAEDDSERARVADRLRVLDRQIDRLVDAVADNGMSAALADRLKTAEAERAALRQQQAAAPAAVDVAAVWRGVKERLRDMLSNGDPRELRAGIAELLGPVLLRVDPATGQTWGDVIVRGLTAGTAKRRPGDPVPALPVTSVAGAGFEPATFGL
ncbi:MAG: recombinase family protein [Burkholderiaceae bacterium]|nr:recombinase family protein [Burkholderiaceae bacterium]